MFTANRGSTKPYKHLCIGLGLKSSTGGRKVIMVNKIGHSIGHNTIEVLETQLTTEVTLKRVVAGTLKMPGILTRFGWDNYGENTAWCLQPK